MSETILLFSYKIISLYVKFFQMTKKKQKLINITGFGNIEKSFVKTKNF